MNDQPDFPLEPGIDISYQLPLDDGSGRVVVFRTLVPQHCSGEEFNVVLDKLSDAAERQKARALMPSYEGMLEDKKAALISETAKLFMAFEEQTALKTQLDDEAKESGRRGPPKLRPDQKNTHIQIEARIAGHNRNVAVLKKEIASEEKRLAIYRGRIGKGE